MHPTTSSVACPFVSLADRGINLDKDALLMSSKLDLLADYVVPVLPEGVKTALSRPVSKWTSLRVWYNPYRQVMITLTSRLDY